MEPLSILRSPPVVVLASLAAQRLLSRGSSTFGDRVGEEVGAVEQRVGACVDDELDAGIVGGLAQRPDVVGVLRDLAHPAL